MEKHYPQREKSLAFLNRVFEQRRELFAVLELFPIPMEVFSPEGISLFVNQAFVDIFRIPAEEIVGRLNIREDPYINHKLGLSAYLHRVFAGEILSLYDMKVPLDEIGQRYPSAQIRPTESHMYQDIIGLPLRGKDDSVAYVVTVFMTKYIYQMRLDALKAKEYMDANWRDDFDLDQIAKNAGMSRYHLSRLFKKMIGMTPYSYYQQVKIEKIKEALRDNSLSISQVFASCDVDYNSGLAKAFKSRTGMTPTQYRKNHKCRKKASGTMKPAKASGFFTAPSFGSGYESESLLFQIVELFPIPIQVFEPGGDIIFINQATLKMWNVWNTSLIYGKYNLLKDPLVNEEFGLRDEIRRTFQGEMVLIQDIKLPLEKFWEWYKTRSEVCDIEAIYTDILNFPVFSADGELIYVVAIFFTSRIYSGRTDVAKAKEYLDNHWREEFDATKLANLVRLSPSHLSRLFKKHTGMTPYGYYQEIKINKLKVVLRDRNVSVGEAFISCGFGYSGNSSRFFKEKTGMTPSEYRKTINN